MKGWSRVRNGEGKFMGVDGSEIKGESGGKKIVAWMRRWEVIVMMGSAE